MHQPTQRRQDVIPAGRLIVISGRPGTGKTTLAKATAQELPACYLRVDAAETALVRAGAAVVTEGYAVIHELAVSNLQLGHTVVVDAVNPVPQARAGWFETAARAQARLVMVELELRTCASIAVVWRSETPTSPDMSCPPGIRSCTVNGHPGTKSVTVNTFALTAPTRTSPSRICCKPFAPSDRVHRRSHLACCRARGAPAPAP